MCDTILARRAGSRYSNDHVDDDHVEEEEEDETLLQPLELPKKKRNVRSSLDEDVHIEPSLDESVSIKEPNLPSTNGTQSQAGKKEVKSERPQTSSRPFDPIDDVDDSDFTPVRQSRNGKRAKKKRSKAPTPQSHQPKHQDLSQPQKSAKASSVSRSPAFQSAVSKKEKKSKPDPPTKYKLPTTSKNSPRGTRKQGNRSELFFSVEDQDTLQSSLPKSSSKRRISSQIATPSNSGLKIPITKESKPTHGVRSKPKEYLDRSGVKTAIQSPTSVLDNPNFSTTASTASTAPNSKPPTHDRRPVLQSDSDTSSYQYHGKRSGRAKKHERNARLLGYDDESSDTSSHLFRESPYGTRKGEYRNARLLEYDDDTNTSSSLGLGRHRPFGESYGSSDLEGSESSRFNHEPNPISHTSVQSRPLDLRYLARCQLPNPKDTAFSLMDKASYLTDTSMHLTRHQASRQVYINPHESTDISLTAALIALFFVSS
jgi:hypothetical protein